MALLPSPETCDTEERVNPYLTDKQTWGKTVNGTAFATTRGVP